MKNLTPETERLRNEAYRSHPIYIDLYAFNVGFEKGMGELEKVKEKLFLTNNLLTGDGRKVMQMLGKAESERDLAIKKLREIYGAHGHKDVEELLEKIDPNFKEEMVIK